MKTSQSISVLHVVGTMNHGGAEMMIMNLYRNIPSHIHFNFLVNQKKQEHYQKGDFDDEIIQRGGTILHIGTQWEMGILPYIKEFRKVIRALKPDVVHIHLNAKGGIIALASALCGVKKIIVHSHADIQFRGSRFSKIVNETELFFQKILIACFATDFWGCSLAANRRLFWPYHYLKSVVINNSIYLDPFLNITREETMQLRKTIDKNEHTLILGNVGRIVRHKNILFLINVLHTLILNGFDAILVIVGRIDDVPYFEEVKSLAASYQLEDHLIFLGDRDDIPLLMSTFNVFVSPSLNEGFGMVAVEAQAAGTPCILSTGFPSTVDMQLGLTTFLDGYDPQQWAEWIIKVKDHKEYDKKKIARSFSLLHFDSKTNAEMICHLYEKR